MAILEQYGQSNGMTCKPLDFQDNNCFRCDINPNSHRCMNMQTGLNCTDVTLALVPTALF